MFVILVLRAISFFFGKYFAICRRSALGAMVSDSDQGGLVDLGYALVIGAISGLPALVIAVVAVVLSHGEGIQEPVASAVVTGLLALGIAVVVRLFSHSVSGGGVEADAAPWDRAFLGRQVHARLLVFPAAADALPPDRYLTVVGSLYRFDRAETTVAIVPRVVAAILWYSFSFFVLTQYNMAVMFTALGRILRRNQTKIGWLREDVGDLLTVPFLCCRPFPRLLSTAAISFCGDNRAT